jgi:hypothetical protein
VRGSIGLFIGTILWMSTVFAQVHGPDLATLRAQCTNAAGTGSSDAVKSACSELMRVCPAPCIAQGEPAIEVVTSGLIRGSYVSVKVKGGLNYMTGGNGSTLIPLTTSSYAVTVISQPSGQTCTVENGAGVVESDTRPQVTLKCSGQRSIGGIVSGLSAGEHVQLVNGSQESLTVSANGRYQFDAEKKSGEEYSVVVNQSPPGKKCTIAGEQQGVVGIADITDLAVTCATLPHAIASAADSPSTGVSATLKRDNLMPLAFPGWQRGEKETASHPELPSTQIIKLTLSDGQQTKYFAEPLGVIRLDAQHAAMITSTIPLDSDTGELDYGCEGSTYCPDYVPIGAYIFTQGDAGWTLTSRADLVTKVFGSEIEKFKVQEWPGHGLVVAFTTSYGYQSQSVTNLTMISLQADRVIPLIDTSLAKSTDMISGSDYLDCQSILDPKYVQTGSRTVDSANCEDTKGHWRF